MSRSVWIKSQVVQHLCFLCESGKYTGVWARLGADCGPEGRVLEWGSPQNRRPIGRIKWFRSLYKRRTLHPHKNTMYLESSKQNYYIISLWVIVKAIFIHSYVTLLIHMHDMTHSYVWPGNHERAQHHLCDMTHPCAWKYSFICVIWLIYMCDQKFFEAPCMCEQEKTKKRGGSGKEERNEKWKDKKKRVK